ncbi:MAG: helix-turn-helix domain-containing protein [Flavobacteriales bacterium]
MIDKTVKKYSKQQGVTLKELAEKVGMTETGLSRALKRKSLKVKTLERISEVLQVPIPAFFGEEGAREGGKDYQQRGFEERLKALEEKVEKLQRSNR